LVVPAALVGKSTTPMHVLDGGFGIDVHHRRLELLGDLRELIRELLRGGYRQRRCRIGTLLCTFLATDRLGNQRSNQNAYGEGGQNRKRVSRPVRFEPIPQIIALPIHTLTPSVDDLLIIPFMTRRPVDTLPQGDIRFDESRSLLDAEGQETVPAISDGDR